MKPAREQVEEELEALTEKLVDRFGDEIPSKVPFLYAVDAHGTVMIAIRDLGLAPGRRDIIMGAVRHGLANVPNRASNTFFNNGRVQQFAPAKALCELQNQFDQVQ